MEVKRLLMCCGLDDYLADHIIDLKCKMEHADKMKGIAKELSNYRSVFELNYACAVNEQMPIIPLPKIRGFETITLSTFHLS